MAYVADAGTGTSGLRVIDVSDATSPVRVGNLTLGSAILAMALHGDYLLAVLDNAAVVTVDVTPPASPAVAGYCVLPEEGSGITLAGNRAFVASGAAGLQVVDVTDPAGLNHVATWAEAADARGITVSGQYAYVADGTAGLAAVQVLNYAVNTADSVVQSLRINAAGDRAVGVKLSPVFTDSIRWEITPDGGGTWDIVPADNQWYTLSRPGNDLRWRTTHTVARPGVYPECSNLEITWLDAAAIIDSICDVPGDEGGWVRIFLTRSGYDVPTEQTLPILNYVIHRRIDDAGLLARVGAAGPFERQWVTPPGIGAVQAVGQVCLNAAALDGRVFTRAAGAGDDFPPGVWEVVGCVPALQLHNYVASVPTVIDSVDGYSVFVVSVHTTTPTEYFVSAPDSGYSVDNTRDLTPPAPPWGFAVLHRAGVGNELSWHGNREPDFLYYKIYRDTVPMFDTDETTLVYQTFDTLWTDPVLKLHPHWYKLTALDRLFNESAPAVFFVATGTVPGAAPARTVLYQNVPNPFNPGTTIRYDLAAPCKISLRIFDVSGRLVRTLVYRYEDAGAKSRHWDGRDNAGRRVASGVYFLRMETDVCTQTRKITLIE